MWDYLVLPWTLEYCRRCLWSWTWCGYPRTLCALTLLSQRCNRLIFLWKQYQISCGCPLEFAIREHQFLIRTRIRYDQDASPPWRSSCYQQRWIWLALPCYPLATLFFASAIWSQHPIWTRLELFLLARSHIGFYHYWRKYFQSHWYGIFDHWGSLSSHLTFLHHRRSFGH